jgi:hypothetical protein
MLRVKKFIPANSVEVLKRNRITGGESEPIPVWSGDENLKEKKPPFGISGCYP